MKAETLSRQPLKITIGLVFSMLFRSVNKGVTGKENVSCALNSRPCEDGQQILTARLPPTDLF